MLKDIVRSEMHGVITPYVTNKYYYTLLKLHNRSVAKLKVEELFQIKNFFLINPALHQEDIQEICFISEQYKLKTIDAYHAFSSKKLGIKNNATFDGDFERVP